MAKALVLAERTGDGGFFVSGVMPLDQRTKGGARYNVAYQELDTPPPISFSGPYKAFRPWGCAKQKTNERSCVYV